MIRLRLHQVVWSWALAVLLWHPFCRVVWRWVCAGVCLLSLASASAETRVLRFATWDSNQALAIQRQIAARFEARYPDVKVQIEAYGSGFPLKIAAAFGAGNAPDVMYMWDFPSYAKSLEPLDAWIQQDRSFDASDILPALQLYSRYQGQTYGIPAGFTSRVMYYNKDMFDAAGLPYPADEWSWQEFAELASGLRHVGKRQYGYAISLALDLYDFQSFFWSAGTSMLSPDGKKITNYFNSAAAKAMFTMFLSMQEKQQMLVLGVAESQSLRDLFLSDKVAMLDAGISLKADLEKQGKRFGITSLPRFGNLPVKTAVSISALAMAKSSQQKTLAWQFIRFYTSQEAVLMRANIDLPVLKSLAESPRFADDKLIRPFYSAMQANDQTPAFLLNPGWMRAQDRLELAIQQIFTYRRDVATWLDKAALQAQYHLKQK